MKGVSEKWKYPHEQRFPKKPKKSVKIKYTKKEQERKQDD